VERLLGAPVSTLAVVFAVALAVAVGVVAALALRNRVFLKLGLRNVSRRRARTAIIVVGLMLGTAIIASALSTGDTMAATIRSSVVRTLGNTDESVGLKSAGATAVTVGQATDTAYFPQDRYGTVAAAAGSSTLIDGVAPAIVEPVAVQDATSQQNEPRVMLFAADPAKLASFGAIRGPSGTVALGDLGASEVFLNDKAAEKLSAARGDEIVVLAAGKPTSVHVRDIVRYDGVGTNGAAVLATLPAAQQLLGRPGQINQILVSNKGGATSGAQYTDAVRRQLQPILEPIGLEAKPVKRDGLKEADAQGNSFMSLFSTFGTFTIAAGVLLIFLVFVLLAAERRGEMGVARAVGTQRGHLVEMFLFEGMAYDLIAAAVGAGLGMAIAFGMVHVLASALQSQGLDLTFTVEGHSVVLAYSLGVLLTLIVVTISAWRVSRLNLVAAIRNLPDPVKRRKRRRWLLGVAGVAAGIMLTVAGITGSQATPLLVGVSIAIVSVVTVLAGLGVNERAAYTVGGSVLVVWLLLPFAVYKTIAPDLSMDFSVWVANGLLVVVGTAWTIVYNADVILAVTLRVFGRFKSLAPVLKTSITTPLRSRFRTGMTLAMFTLVVFTLVVGTTTSGAFTSALDDVDAFGGGYQVRAEVSPVSPAGNITDAARSVPELPSGAITRIASESFVPVSARQSGAASYEDYPLRGVDDTFARTTTYGFATMAKGYTSDREVWDALATTSGLAVVDPMVVPRRNNWGFNVLPEFQLTGFFLEDQGFDPVSVDTTDPRTGTNQRYTVIGVLKDSVPLSMAGITVSQRSLTAYGDRARPTVYYFSLAAGVDPVQAAKHIETAFLANGMQAQAFSEILADAVGTSVTFQRIILGFMGLGLVIGVAALAVISARSVVERRQQIGVLRAIGFQQRMIKLSFLLEASFVTLVAIVAGTALGLIVSFNVITDAAQLPSWDNLRFVVPWMTLSLIFVVVYAAALVTTWAPAHRAARVYPAEALRYQ
jgi:putative ABC transport system permease protein